MTPYILIAISLGLMALVALTRTKIAPLVVSLALVSNIVAVECARGWPVDTLPPRQGILYGAWLGEYLLISTPEAGSIPRLYHQEYDPMTESKLKEKGGALYYDLDAKPSKSEHGTGSGGGGIPGPDDLTDLPESADGLKDEAP